MANKVLHYVLIAFSALLLASCSHKEKCTDQLYYYMRFSPANGDTIVTVNRYFKQVSYKSLLESSKDTMHQQVNEFMVLLHRYTDRCVDYDWEFIFQPSGRVVRIRDMAHAPRREKMANSDTHECGNDLSMVVNDSAYYVGGISGNAASGIFMEIAF